MNLPTFTPATRARLMLAMNDALNIQDDDTTSQEAAFVSAVTHSESPGTTLLLAEVIEDLIDRHTSDMGVQHVIVDPSALYSAGYDSHTVCTALKLAGLMESRVSGKTVWATTKNPKNTLPRIAISGDILNDWIAL